MGVGLRIDQRQAEQFKKILPKDIKNELGVAGYTLQ